MSKGIVVHTIVVSRSFQNSNSHDLPSYSFQSTEFNYPATRTTSIIDHLASLSNMLIMAHARVDGNPNFTVHDGEDGFTQTGCDNYYLRIGK